MANQVKSVTDTVSYIYANRSGKPLTDEIKVGDWLYTNDSLKIVYAERVQKHTLDYLEIGNTIIPMTGVDSKGITFTGTLPVLNDSGKVDVIVHDKLLGASSTPIVSNIPKATIIGLNLSNCFTNYKEDDKIDIGSTITFTPNSGYEFTENGTVTVYAYGMSHDEPISKDTGTYKVPEDCDQLVFTMSATKKVVAVPKAKITALHLTNCVASVNGIVIKEDDTVDIGSTITFTPNSGYEFTENGTVTVYAYGMSHDEPISKDTGTYKVPEDCDQLVFTMSATKKVVAVPKAKITALHLTNCVASVNGIVIKEDDTVDIGSTITVKANKNFKFTSNGSSSLTNTEGVSYHKPILVDTTDKTIATLVIEDNVNTVDIEINAIEDVTVPDVGGGFINTYVVNNNILNELSKNRFTYKDSGSGGSSSVTVIDNATMITSLLHIPYSLKSITGSDNDIILGDHNTKVLAPRLTDNVLRIDFGTIKVDELNKDNSDYQNTDCELYVPYSSPIKLDSENIINKSIHIVYVIDVYSGSGKIVLSDDDSIVGTYNIDVGSEIPFVQSTNNSHVSNLKMSISNMITRPYIRIKYYDRLDNTYNSNKLALVSDMKGFIQVNNILKIDSDDIDSESFDEIKNQLNSGIII